MEEIKGKISSKSKKQNSENPLKKVSFKKEKSSASTLSYPSKVEENSSCFWGYARFFALLFLILNFILGSLILCKLITLQKWIIMGTGGEENLQKLEILYKQPEYQEYFKGEIKTLENRIENLGVK